MTLLFPLSFHHRNLFFFFLQILHVLWLISVCVLVHTAQCGAECAFHYSGVRWLNSLIDTVALSTESSWAAILSIPLLSRMVKLHWRIIGDLSWTCGMLYCDALSDTCTQAHTHRGNMLLLQVNACKTADSEVSGQVPLFMSWCINTSKENNCFFRVVGWFWLNWVFFKTFLKGLISVDDADVIFGRLESGSYSSSVSPQRFLAVTVFPLLTLCSEHGLYCLVSSVWLLNHRSIP